MDRRHHLCLDTGGLTLPCCHPRPAQPSRRGLGCPRQDEEGPGAGHGGAPSPATRGLHFPFRSWPILLLRPSEEAAGLRLASIEERQALDPCSGRSGRFQARGCRSTETGTFPTFASDIPSGSSCQKPTFKVRLTGIVKRQKAGPTSACPESDAGSREADARADQ